jgi:hypothetical protein
MKSYKIKSPSGRFFTVLAETIFEAVERVCIKESYKYSNAQYLKINRENG